MQNQSTSSTQTAPSANDIDALDKLIAKDRIKTINGKEIAIRPFKMKALPEVVRAAQPIVHLIMMKDKLDITNLVLMYSEECLTLTAVLADEPRAFIDELSIDEGIELFIDLFEVNLDFFIQKVLPRVTTSVRKITGQIAKATPPSVGQNDSKS